MLGLAYLPNKHQPRRLQPTNVTLELPLVFIPTKEEDGGGDITKGRRKVMQWLRSQMNYQERLPHHFPCIAHTKG